MITAEEFEAMTVYNKGYVVYKFGHDKNEPNVPLSHSPTKAEKEEYDRGQSMAMLDVAEAYPGRSE